MMVTALLLLGLAVQVDDKAAEEAVDRFKQGMKSPQPSGRAAAVSELAKTPHDKTVNLLIGCLGDGTREVRVAAAKGLGAFGDWKRKVGPMLQVTATSNPKDFDVRMAAFEALGALGDPTAVPVVHKGFKEEDVRVAKSAIKAAGAMRIKESLDALLELQKDVQKAIKNKQHGGYKDDKGQVGDEKAMLDRLADVQKEITKAFQTITREKWTTPQEWEVWFQRKRATFEVPKDEPKK